MKSATTANLQPVAGLETESNSVTVADFQSKTEHDCPDGGPCVGCCGRRIRQRRESLGLKQGDVSKAHWEYGHCFPSIEALYFLSRSLRCSIDWLIAGTNPPHDTPPEVVRLLGKKAPR